MRPRKMRLAVRGLRHWTGAMRTSENAVKTKVASVVVLPHSNPPAIAGGYRITNHNAPGHRVAVPRHAEAWQGQESFVLDLV